MKFWMRRKERNLSLHISSIEQNTSENFIRNEIIIIIDNWTSIVWKLSVHMYSNVQFKTDIPMFSPFLWVQSPEIAERSKYPSKTKGSMPSQYFRPKPGMHHDWFTEDKHCLHITLTVDTSDKRMLAAELPLQQLGIALGWTAMPSWQKIVNCLWNSHT